MADLIIKGVNIPNKRTIELMRAELACVSRCECNRCCEDCDLVQDVDELIVAFRATIRILEAVANAIPLPEGHGRGIDADALFEKMYRLSDNEGAHKDSRVDDALILRDSACYLIEDAPTIVPAEGGTDECSEN